MEPAEHVRDPEQRLLVDRSHAHVTAGAVEPDSHELRVVPAEVGGVRDLESHARGHREHRQERDPGALPERAKRYVQEQAHGVSRVHDGCHLDEGTRAVGSEA